jgi:hypothetical protein
MTCIINNNKPKRRLPAKLAAGFALSVFFLLGTVLAASAEDHRGGDRGGDHRGGERGGDHRGGYGGGYYRAPPVIYGSPYYYAPPVVYGYW